MDFLKKIEKMAEKALVYSKDMPWSTQYLQEKMGEIKKMVQEEIRVPNRGSCDLHDFHMI